MGLYTATVTDKSGNVVWAMAYGCYVEAPDASAARAQADAHFREPIPAAECDDGGFTDKIRAKQARVIAEGYTLTVRRKS